MESVQPLCLTKEQESQIAHPPRAIARHGGRQSHGKYLPNIWKVEIAARRKDGAAWMHSYVVSAPLGLRDNRYATMLFVIARVSKPLADRFYFQDEWRKQDPKPLQIEEFTAIEWRRQSALEAPVSDDEVDSGKGNILLAGSIARIEKGVIDDKPILSRVPGDPVIRIEPNSEQRAFMEALAFIRKQKDPGALHALVRSINFVDRVRGLRSGGEGPDAPPPGELFPVASVLVEFGETAIPHIMDAFASLSEEKLETDEGRLLNIQLMRVLGCILSNKANLAFEDGMLRTKDKLAQERLAKAQQRFLAGGYSKLPRNFYALPK